MLEKGREIFRAAQNYLYRNVQVFTETCANCGKLIKSLEKVWEVTKQESMYCTESLPSQEEGSTGTAIQPNTTVSDAAGYA